MKKRKTTKSAVSASIAKCLNVGHQTPIHLSPVVKQNLIQLRAAILNAPTNLFHSTTEKHSFAEYKDRHAADYQLIPSFARSYIEQHVPTHSMHFVYDHSTSTTSTQNPQKIEVLFFIFEDRDVLRIPAWIKKMSQWLHVALQQPSQPGCRRPEHLQLTFFLTPMEKVIPSRSNVIPAEENINSGFTFSCRKNNQILLFRREDLFKVFLHETFHALGLDFSSRYEDAKRDIDPDILRCFPGCSPQLDVSLFETYCEIWAQCIHLLLLTAPMDAPNTLDAFLRALLVDRRFVCYQTHKLLQHCYHRRSYRDLLLKSGEIKTEYKEHTNVFAYFILRAGVLFCLDDFFQICLSGNKICLSGNKDEEERDSTLCCGCLMMDYERQVPLLKRLIVETTHKHPDLLAEMEFLSSGSRDQRCLRITRRSARMTSF